MESFANNLIKRPLKLFMLCMVLYLATQSFVVGLFVAVVGLSFLYQKAVAWSQVVPAAPKVSTPDYQSSSKPEVQQMFVQPELQYERSAVVTPIRRTGTHNRS
ncbi:hypothetical protein SAMN05216345_111109 [Cupriavidus sp. YR651]|uniref:hypothetical protein n=1 Tax=Cupriavidus sp. YR651 TaxID=1855315 RepID=UPI00088B310E|nr:hypothetical protein [Cupriavidus sp. YR651]SDD57646.1 hypothetical protein SAMN05216345_111109 [Cupriavidus sp. YR651]